MICWEYDFEVQSLHTQHTFHLDCLLEWLSVSRANRCPLCSTQISADSIEFMEQSCYEQHYEFNARLEYLIHGGTEYGISDLLADYPVNTKILSEGIRRAMKERKYEVILKLSCAITNAITLELLFSEFSNRPYLNMIHNSAIGLRVVDYIFYLSILYNLKELAICCLQNGADAMGCNGMALIVAMNTLDFEYISILISLGCAHMSKGSPEALIASVCQGCLPLVQYFHELGCNKAAHKRALRIAADNDYFEVIKFLDIKDHQ